MSTHKDALLYPLADALQTQLHLSGAGFHGVSTRRVSIGPWPVPLTVRVQSCVVTDTLVTAQVHIKHNLWMYVLCDAKGQRLRAVLFDGATIAKLKNKNANLGGDAEAIAALLKPVTRLYLRYSAEKETWRYVDAFNLV